MQPGSKHHPKLSCPVFVLLFSTCYLLFSFVASAQQYNSYHSKTNRILFVLDASGSMKGLWEGTSKFELSKQVLIHTIDSISKVNPHIEFALRVFGHQSQRAANNCKDTKLEVPFSRNNLPAIEKKLSEIKPQGQTPIEYTLLQSITDFPADSMADNAIVLITDGNETCGGAVCTIAEQMEAKGIVLKPFIIGLGLSDSLRKKFECAGLFYDVQNEDMFTHVMKVVISRALNATTAQINLLDGHGFPTETNLEITLYDHSTGKVKYEWIHTLNAKGNPDTLQLDSKIKYDLMVHSIPPVERKDIELIPGIHNVIAADVPQGTLELKSEAQATNAPVILCMVKSAGQHEIICVQDLNRSQKYLAGKYDLEILTLPRIEMRDVNVEPGKITSIKIPKAGMLTINPSEPGVASLFSMKGNELEKVYDFYQVTSSKSLPVQPGSYLLIFRPDKGKQSQKTKQLNVQITSGKTFSIRL